MDQKQPLNFSLKTDVITRRIFWCALGIELLLVFLDVFVNHYQWSSLGPIRRMVNITREDSLSNWFSSFQSIMVGYVLLLIAFAVKNQMQDKYYKRKFYCWVGIGIFFIYMGIDDAIKFHERMGTSIKVLVSRSAEASGPGFLDSAYNAFPSYSWQIFLGPFFIAMGIFLIWFLRKELMSHNLWYWVLVAIGLYALAVELDFVEGMKIDFIERLDNAPYERIASFFSTEDYRIRHMSKTLEEFLEMFGTTIFLTVFLKKLFRLSQEWKINLVE